MRARLDGRTALWTLDPERFALQRLAPGAAQPLAGFAADVVEGHFEQGGRTRHRHARLDVERVVLHRPLDAAPSVRTTARYVPVTIAKHGMQADLRALALQAPLAGSVHYCAGDLR